MTGFTTAVLSLLLTGPVAAVRKTFDNILTNGSIHAEFTSTEQSSLDGPKLGWPGSANDTSYDWWYFDAVSASNNESVTVVFYNGGPYGFVNHYYGGPLSVSLTGTFANGTQFDFSVPARSAVIDHGPDQGISVDYVDSGFSFTGSNVKGRDVGYVLRVDSPAMGVKGSIRLHSRAPAHYPCGLDTAGANLQMLPHVGWSNAIPDAHATISLAFTSSSNNETLAFTDGVGYHDKNWGDQPFVSSTEQWYWGHARLGPYSLVWFDAFDLSGTEYFSGYVAANGSVLASSCVAGAVVARPWGENGAFPPNVTTGVPQGMEVVFDLGEGQVLSANVTTGPLAMAPQTGYARMLGRLVGGVKGAEVYEGTALFEQFDLSGVF
ncbi:unnamed protein product [Discula destructiva]